MGSDVTYHNKEILPSEEKGKRIVYDVYCTFLAKRSDSAFFPSYQYKKAEEDVDASHHFILEMQNNLRNGKTAQPRWKKYCS